MIPVKNPSQKGSPRGVSQRPAAAHHESCGKFLTMAQASISSAVSPRAAPGSQAGRAGSDDKGYCRWA